MNNRLFLVIPSCVTIIRPANSAMVALSVSLGFWLGNARMPLKSLLLLIIAGTCAAGFGNIVNDISDIETDRISHSGRPLPRGRLNVLTAGLYALMCALTALVCAFHVSPFHAVVTAVPLVLLFVYTRSFKGVPLLGNILVSALVAYPLIYGALGAPLMHRLWLPALLAFLLNLSREIVKDLEDIAGDRAAGYTTTAVLPRHYIYSLLALLSFLYFGVLFLPFALTHFGVVYVTLCLAFATPIHLARLRLFFFRPDANRLHRVSFLIKLEMLAGLSAIALDELVRQWYFPS